MIRLRNTVERCHGGMSAEGKMISTAAFENDIEDGCIRKKSNAMDGLERQIDAAIRLHAENIATAKARGEKALDKIVTVDIPIGRDSDWSVFSHLGGERRDILGPYRAAGWIVELGGVRSADDAGDEGPALNVRFVSADQTCLAAQ